MQSLEIQMQNKFQQQLNQSIENKESFLLFRKPNTDKIELWLDEKEGDFQFVFHRFDDAEQIEFKTNEIYTLPIQDFNFQIDLDLEVSNVEEEISYADYIDLVSKTIDELKSEISSTKKIVISRIKSFDNEGVNLVETFKKLHQAYPNAYVYLWYTPDNDVWIGASPELLLAEDNLTINTVSLAGTLPKNEEWTSKEIHEQQVVTDYIVDKLKIANAIKVDGPYTVDAGFFNHLKSYISAKVESYDEVYPILKALHPTPAVCGMPKEEAKQFILKNEGYDRSYYAGFFGYKSPESSLYFVNLRCAKIYKNKVKIYVGGGIMPDSNPEKEWQETELKSKTIGNLLVTDQIIFS